MKQALRETVKNRPLMAFSCRTKGRLCKEKSQACRAGTLWDRGSQVCSREMGQKEHILVHSLDHILSQATMTEMSNVL